MHLFLTDWIVQRKTRTEANDALAFVDDSANKDSVETSRAESSVEGEDHAPAAKKKPSSSLYHPPTHNELQALKETENLFCSNLMKLQASSLSSPRTVTIVRKY